MRRRNTEILKEVILQVLKQNRLDRPLLEKHIVDAWPVVLGQNIMNYTTDLKINNKILFVKLSSSVLRHDLFLNRQQIIKSLNDHVGQEVISEIIFK